MRALKTTHLWLGLVPVLALAACTASGELAGTRSSPAAPAVASAQPVPGGSARWGGSIATMADQYNRPHPGAVAAAGASAWVPPAPPPAFVVTDLPPASPPAPPPAAVANRQPTPAPAPAAVANRQPTPAPASAARPAVDASQVVRPEAAAPEASTPAPAATLSAATRETGRKLFSDYSCGACHTLADAGASGSIGPSLDRNANLNKGFVVTTVSDGRGAMPSFAGQMSDAEIATLADYIVGAARK
jgi:mono/diheme cytochrome c family protein